MPITAPHISITLRYEYLGQLCQNTQYYRPVGAAFLTATMLGVLEAYWDGLFPILQPMMPSTTATGRFISLVGTELGGGGTFAEYVVPALEQIGTRTGLTVASAAPSYVNWGFRQVVNTRATRPGQKRFPWVAEADTVGNALDAGSITLWSPLAAFLTTPDTLGTPVATGVLHPEVSGTIVAGAPTVFQDITGFVFNVNATSQVSRKAGRGT